MGVECDELEEMDDEDGVNDDTGARRPRLQVDCAACAEVQDRESKQTIQVRNGMMVARVRKVGGRRFAGREMRKVKGVYNWRPVSSEIMQTLLLLVQCASVQADIPLMRKSSVHIRTDLRTRLAASLAAGEKERAFAKKCGFDDRPRADNAKDMMEAFPNKQDVDWEAPPARSSFNASLCKMWHARHCGICSVDQVHDDCYFKLLHHFLHTGFNPPVKTGLEPYCARPSRVAYVDKWREEEARCRDAFEKWAADASGLMSAPVSAQPQLCLPLLPVVRAKDKWRHTKTGADYKVRLCLDFKNGGLNDMFEDWRFRYWGLESVAETVSKNDWLGSIDISRFYLRLAAGRRLRDMQWFQDPDSYGVDVNANERMRAARRRFRQLCSVAFGLKSAPAFASAVSAEVKAILESFGVSVAGVYIDDFLIRGATEQECRENMAKAMAILTALGIPPNEKTQPPRSPEQGITFLGVLIRTSDCSMSVTAEQREYVASKLADMLRAPKVSLKELESVCGSLSWISQVFIPGRPRRSELFKAIKRLRMKPGLLQPRGELRRQLQWWLHTLRSDKLPASSYFWDAQPQIPLMCSDASGEDGWGACAMGLHVVGDWPDEWKQSAGAGVPSMLFKELVPVVIMLLLLAPFNSNKVFAAATDNAGVAFVLNAMSCRCPWSLALLRPLADSLAKHHVGLIAGHAHRRFNEHADDLSHALSADMWRGIRAQARHSKVGRLQFHFVVHDMATKEAFAATMSFPRISTADATDAP